MAASRIRPLTVKEVEKLAATKPTTIKHRYLGGVPGFVLVHTPTGHTSYGLVYRVGGQRKKLTLGSTKRFSLGEARQLAGKYRTAIEEGGDPHGEKLIQRTQEAAQREQVDEPQKFEVGNMWDTYMQLVGSQLRSKYEKERIFRCYILPVVQGLCVTEIERRHTLKIIDKLVAQNKRRMADKVRQEGAAFFQWLIEREHVDRNVFAGIRKASGSKSIRTRVLADDEIAAIWHASDAEGHWGYWIKLLILTGCRNMEVRGARWSEIDFEQRTWTIPAERYKTGRSHTVFLTDPMIALWRAAPRFEGSDLVFPGRGRANRPMSGDQKVKGRIHVRARDVLRETSTRELDNWCIHDFRRTIATGLQRLGFRPEIADQVIGHVGSTRAGAGAHYLHHRYEDERKEALEAWSKHIFNQLRPPADDAAG